MRLIRIIMDSLLMIVGLCFLVGAFDIGVTGLWLGIVLTGVGVLVLSENEEFRDYWTGLTFLGLGVFLLLRNSNVISAPVLSWLFGGFLMVTGAVNLLQNVQGEAPLFKTFAKKQ